ncbi:helix-turn-helix domain-containing protein [Streptomyces sp. NPDC004031]
MTRFTPEDRERHEQQIRALHAEGLPRNEIARRLGIGTRTVSVYAVRLGLTFDNASMTEIATQNRKAQLAARRMDLAEALQGDAERLTEQMWEPAKVYSFGGKDNTYEERSVDEPPADAKRALMGAAGMAIDRSLKLVPPETDQQGLAAVDQWLRGMMGGSDDAG